MTEITRQELEILVVEDQDAKFDDLVRTLGEIWKIPYAITRASTVVEAESSLSEKNWDLMILDISMDISRGSLGPMRGGHANLGGVDILEHMYLFEIEIPTIILTGFDYFQSRGLNSEKVEMINLADIETRAKEKIKGSFMGCIRYGSPEWRDQLADKISSIVL